MPELPEVESLVRTLSPKIKGKTCANIEIYDKRLSPPPIKNNGNLKLNEINRFGKEILFQFENEKNKNKLYLLIHLRMSGRLLFHADNKNKNFSYDALHTESYLQHKIIRLKSNNFTKHIRACFHFKNAKLYFFDVRRFGTFKWTLEKPQLPAFTVDPIKEKLNPDQLKVMLNKSKNLAIKQFLLKQDRVIGIGNIYASEILFASKISPLKKCGDISNSEIKKLTQYIPAILNKAILHNGTTISDFQLEDASVGNFQNFLKVYGRENKKCKKCAKLIKKITQNQRSTFFCESCQK